MNGKSLQEMTLEELWQLFPIILVPHNPQWKICAEHEMNLLHVLLHEFNPIITHIGSTAIPGIAAKPIIDILIETPDTSDWDIVTEMLSSKGYIRMSRSHYRMSFNRGYTPEGFAETVFHIHFHLNGDSEEILFRDYLRHNPTIAHEYEALKYSLAKKYRNNRDAYTHAKSTFIKSVLSKAKSLPNPQKT